MLEKLSNKLILSVFWRSFFLQGLWNFERMQNVGFIFSILPAVREIYPDPEKRKEVLLRHLEFFNTNPYIVNIILGLIIAMEQDISKGKITDAKEITAIKTNIAGPLAAIGDNFFWASWRPFTALLSISLILFFRKTNTFLGNWIAPLFCLLFHNIFIVFFRFWSLKISYHFKNKVVKVLAVLEFKYIIDLTRFVGLFFLVAIIIAYIFFGLMSFKLVMAGLAVLILSVLFISLNFTTELLLYSVIGFCVFLAYFKIS